MTKHLLLAIGSFLLVSGTIALQGCADADPYYGYGGYGPGYYSRPAYSSGRGYYAGSGYGAGYNEHRYWQDRDINNDVRAIQRGQANIRRDKQELREAQANRDYDAAAHERAEIQQRREKIRARQA